MFKRVLGLIAPVLVMMLLIAGPVAAEKRSFEMTIDTVTFKVSDQLTYTAFAFNGQIPGPLIHVKEGDEVTIKVINRTELTHTIHWHGIYNTWQNDGVPSVTQPEIKPGETFTYTWIADPTGSLWYHCHVNVHEHIAYRGMWGPLIVDPKNPTAYEKKATKDAILMFSAYDAQWAAKPGFGGHPTDVPTYFALNGRVFPFTQPIRVKKGDVLRLRLYGAGGEIHSIHTHGHAFTVINKDGWPLPQPYKADTVKVGPGDRYDILIEMDNPGFFVIHDHIDKHVTTDGKYPGGVITAIEYEELAKPDFYVWKDIDYNPDYFFQDSIKKYGLIEQPFFKGTPPERKRPGKH